MHKTKCYTVLCILKASTSWKNLYSKLFLILHNAWGKASKFKSVKTNPLGLRCFSRDRPNSDLWVARPVNQKLISRQTSVEWTSWITYWSTAAAADQYILTSSPTVGMKYLRDDELLYPTHLCKWSIVQRRQVYKDCAQLF